MGMFDKFRGLIQDRNAAINSATGHGAAPSLATGGVDPRFAHLFDPKTQALQKNFSDEILFRKDMGQSPLDVNNMDLNMFRAPQSAFQQLPPEIQMQYLERVNQFKQ